MLKLDIGLFGNATDSEIGEIFDKVAELLNDDKRKASLGVENSLIFDDVNKNSTAIDGRSATNGSEPTSTSQGISAGLKVGISFLALAAVAFAVVVAYRSSRRNGQHEAVIEGDEEEGLDGSNPPSKKPEDSHRLA